MSLVGSIIGIRGLEVERVDRRDTIRIWAKPRFGPACPHFQKRPVRIKATHQRAIKHSRQGTRVMLLHLRESNYHSLDCGRYFRYQFLGIRPRFRTSESYRLEVFETHDGWGDPAQVIANPPH